VVFQPPTSIVDVAFSRLDIGLIKINKNTQNIIKKLHNIEKSVSLTDLHKETINPIRKIAKPILVSKNKKSIIDLALTRPTTSKAASVGDMPVGIILITSLNLGPKKQKSEKLRLN
jgi:hypothetical protein